MRGALKTASRPYRRGRGEETMGKDGCDWRSGQVQRSESEKPPRPPPARGCFAAVVEGGTGNRSERSRIGELDQESVAARRSGELGRAPDPSRRGAVRLRPRARRG